MNTYFEKVPIPDHIPFLIREYDLPAFDAPRHFHPQLELTLILESEGKRFVGDDIAIFKEGDLCLIGPNVPHYWYNYPSTTPHRAKSIVLQFEEDFISPSIAHSEDFKNLVLLIENSRRGLQYLGDAQKEISEAMKKLTTLVGLEAYIQFLKVIHLLINSTNFRHLSKFQNYGDSFDKNGEDRINKIYKYVLDNFRNDVSLSVAASVLDMHKTAFCHYFKKRTRKNFSDFVNEIRVNYACKLLTDTDKTISEICYESGFANLSYFNRRFKEIKGNSPVVFRKQVKNID